MMTYLNARLAFYKMFNKKEKCFFGSTWDCNEYLRVLGRSGIYIPDTRIWTYTNDFENCDISKEQLRDYRNAYSGIFSAKISADQEFACKFDKFFSEFAPDLPGKIHITIRICKYIENPVHALLVCNIGKDGKSLFRQSKKIDDFIHKTGTWTEIHETIRIPYSIDPGSLVSVYIWNPGRSVFYADDLLVRFE